MKISRSICSVSVTATGILMLALVAPSSSFAHDQACHPRAYQQISPQERGQWAKNQMDREAAWLEIKASQQTAWEAYITANVELLNIFDEQKPLSPNTDAATVMRQHAEHATTFAQNISRLADATEKLQAVLNEDQRKVLDRIVRMHSQFQGGRFVDGGEHERWHPRFGSKAAPNASKSSPKATAPAKPKN